MILIGLVHGYHFFLETLEGTVINPRTKVRKSGNGLLKSAQFIGDGLHAVKALLVLPDLGSHNSHSLGFGFTVRTYDLLSIQLL